jgi:hypothetical protein
MVKHRTHKRHHKRHHKTHKRRHRKGSRSSGIIPRPVAKGVRDINKITGRVARGIDRYPVAALKAVAGEVLKPRSLPRLKIGGYDSKAVRHLINAAPYPGAVAKTAKSSKGGKKHRKRGGDHCPGKTMAGGKKHRKRGGMHCGTKKKKKTKRRR